MFIYENNSTSLMINRKPLLLLVAVPFLLIATSSYFENIDATKSEGTKLTATNSDLVCGDELCSEVTGDNKHDMDNKSTEAYVY